MKKGDLFTFILIGGLMLMNFSAYKTYSQKPQNLTGSQKLYICMFDLGPQAKAFLADHQIVQVALFGNKVIESANNSSVNIVVLSDAIKKSFPDSTATGFAALDWEGKFFDALQNNAPDSPDFKNAINSFMQAIKFAKALRPNVKWGFYGLPFRTYWHRDQNWINKSLNIKSLLQTCDIFFPSLYIFYKEGSQGKRDNESYATDNLKQFLALANEMNKPVMPFIWHRYHDSNKQIGLQLISEDEFQRYLQTILQVNVKGQKVAGLVWWGADGYFYNVKSKALMDEMSLHKEQNFEEYHDALIVKYGQDILKTIHDSN